MDAEYLVFVTIDFKSTTTGTARACLTMGTIGIIPCWLTKTFNIETILCKVDKTKKKPAPKMNKDGSITLSMKEVMDQSHQVEVLKRYKYEDDYTFVMQLFLSFAMPFIDSEKETQQKLIYNITSRTIYEMYKDKMF